MSSVSKMLNKMKSSISVESTIILKGNRPPMKEHFDMEQVTIRQRNMLVSSLAVHWLMLLWICQTFSGNCNFLAEVSDYAAFFYKLTECLLLNHLYRFVWASRKSVVCVRPLTYSLILPVDWPLPPGIWYPIQFPMGVWLGDLKGRGSPRLSTWPLNGGPYCDLNVKYMWLFFPDKAGAALQNTYKVCNLKCY